MKRLSKTNMAVSSQSTASRRSERTHVIAVSVEYPRRKPDWVDGSRQLTSKYVTSWGATGRSNVLETTDRFDIGLCDVGLASSKPDFFRIGVTNEFLKEAGTQPVAMAERLNRYVTNGVSKSETSLSIETGNGSAADDLSGSRAMAAATLSDDSDVNSVNATAGGARRIVGVMNRTLSTWFVPPFRRKSWIDHQRRRHHRHDVHVPTIGRQ